MIAIGQVDPDFMTLMHDQYNIIHPGEIINKWVAWGEKQGWFVQKFTLMQFLNKYDRLPNSLKEEIKFGGGVYMKNVVANLEKSLPEDELLKQVKDFDINLFIKR